jgi:magnesium chelatase family protein
LQLARQQCLNAHLGNRKLMAICTLDKNVETTLLDALEKLRMSARSYHKLLKLARTIADLAAVELIRVAHIAEAIAYRQQDKRRA